MTDRYRSQFDASTPNHPHAAAVRLVGEDHDVLEIGCWNGHVTQVMTERGNRVVGVDVDAEQLEANEWLQRAHLIDLDVVALTSVERGPFDVIVAGDVLEHLRDPGRVLTDLVSLLRPDGRLVVSVPHVGHIDVRLHLLAGRWEYQDFGLLDRTHLRWFTRESLRDLLASVGFVAVAMELVTSPLGTSRLGLDTDGYPDDAVRYIRADPDAEVFQFVVEAVPAAHAAGRPDVLEAVERQHIDFADEAAQRAAELAALRNEVDAWRNSRVVRLTAPVRRARNRLTR